MNKDLKFHPITGRIIQDQPIPLWFFTKTGTVRVPKD